MATTLSYNGVQFGFLKTQAIDQTPVFDPSNTDQIYTRCTISVESILYLNDDLNTFYNGKLGIPSGNSEPTDIASRIAILQTQLEQPRKRLIFQYNGVTLAPSVAGLDEDNGPRVKFCKITNLTDLCVRIEWQCEVALNLCGNNTGQFSLQNPISSLRYETSQNIDDNGYTTFTTTGLLIGRSNVLAAIGQSVDSLRQYITPPLIQGFTRTGQYTIQSDGLRIKFALKDEQKFLQPNAPFIKCDGTFTRTCTNGSRWTAEVSLKGTYQYPSDRLAAVGAAINIAFTRLMAGDPITQANGAPIVQSGTVREHMYAPVVEVLLSARANPPTQTVTTVTQGWWARNFPNLASPFTKTYTPRELREIAEQNAAIEAANAKAVGLGSISLAATQKMGFGVAPTQTTTGSWDLTGIAGTGMLFGFQVLAQQLRDECTATAAATATTTSVLSGIPSTASTVSPTTSNGPAVFSSTQSGNVESGTPGTYATWSNNSPSADPTIAAEYIAASEGNVQASADPSIIALGTLVNVTISDQVTVDQLNSPYVGNATPGVWDDYTVEYEYRDHARGESKFNGTMVAHATVAGLPPVRCQIRQTAYYLDCAFTSERQGGAPEVPAPQDYPNWLLLNSRINKPSLDVGADGVTLTYKVSGQIEWLWTGLNTDGNYAEPDVAYPIPTWLDIDYTTLPDCILVSDPNLDSPPIVEPDATETEGV